MLCPVPRAPQGGPTLRAGAHQKGDTTLCSGAQPEGKGIG